ncbi:SusC/RagA family TonB-linked outer membrane protein [Niabella sp. 22666]|uniref:SusC/RagA family TonB-linked outer membrane protein n=1 Tax=Niabella sp. 22666 TaxID=3453954 RepID=UPI003F828E51
MEYYLRSKRRTFSKLLLFTLIALCTFSGLNAQNIRVTGSVMDEAGKPVNRATVMVKGAASGTSSDSSGHFTLHVPGEQSTLVFSAVGFTDQEKTVGTEREINIVLKQSLSDLDEIVVVGYGTQRKRDVTGAISSINAKTIEEKQPVTIFDAIQGAAPGVRVMSNSGAPGSSSSITIRGLSTLSDAGVSPLYIVDGAPMDDINNINPNDVQSIEILKDAASAAIYGSRSANGVIIITTKKGTSEKPRITVGYLRSYNKLSNRISQANRLQRQMFDRRGNLGLDPKPDDSTAFSKNSDNDYQALMTQTAVRNQFDLGIMGGNKTLSYFSSLQYLDETGIMITSYNKRFSFRTNIDYKPSKNFSMATRVNFSYQNKNDINEGNMLQQALQRPPGMALYLPDGEYIYFNGGRRNPLAEAYLRKDITQVYKGVIYQTFDLTVAKGLTLHADASADVQLERSNEFTSKLLSNGNPPISVGRDNITLPIRIQGNALANYKHTFGTAHNFNAMVGMNIERRREEEVNIRGTLFVTEAVETLNAAGLYDLTNVYSTAIQSSLAGFVGRLGYDYKGRYLLNVNFRRDGSSVFGAANRWGNFPSVSVGWRLSDEQFMSSLKGVVTDAKLRASYGATGNSRIGEYDAAQQYIFGGYFYNGVSGVRTNTRMGNPFLKWESTTQKNIGLDLTLWGGRLSFTGDYYIKETSDLLYDSPLPFEIGFPNRARVNAGAIENRGLELMVSGFPIRQKNFSWQTTVNWSNVRNKITELPVDYIDDIWSVQQGKEAGNFFGYKYLGIYQYDQSNAYTEDYKTRLIPQFQKDGNGNVIIQKNNQPVFLGYTLPDGTPYTGAVKQLTANGVVSKGGDVIWENLPDANGVYNNNIGNEDRQFLGHGQPRWSLGWSNSISYREFALSFNLYGNFGNKIYNENRRNLASFSNNNTTPDAYFILNMWKYPGQITDAYIGGDKAADNMRRGGSQYLENGSFVRLQSTRLSYSLPARLRKKVASQNLVVYVYGNNLLTWTEYKGFDPEVSQVSVLKPGNDAGRYPHKREYGLGLNVTF